MKLPTGITILAFILVELALVIKIGSILGVLNTLALMVLSAMIGAHVLRTSSVALARAYDPSRATPVRLTALADDGMNLAVGLALVVPCVLAKGLALLTLVPPIRAHVLPRLERWLVAWHARASESAATGATGKSAQASGEVIEGEFERICETTVDSNR